MTYNRINYTTFTLLSCTNDPSTWTVMFFCPVQHDGHVIFSSLTSFVIFKTLWNHHHISSCFTPWCYIRTKYDICVCAQIEMRAMFLICLRVSTVTEEFLLPTPTTTHLLQQPHTALVPWWATKLFPFPTFSTLLTVSNSFCFFLISILFASLFSMRALCVFFPPFPLHGFERWWHLLA